MFDHKGYTDKAKAKTDHAAARHAAAAASHSFADLVMAPDVPQNLVAHHDFTQESDALIHDTEEAILPLSGTELPGTDLLRSKLEVVGRFMQLMVPILVGVYAASVVTPIRVKTLTGLLGLSRSADLKIALHVGIFSVIVVTYSHYALSPSPLLASHRPYFHRRITHL